MKEATNDMTALSLAPTASAQTAGPRDTPGRRSHPKLRGLRAAVTALVATAALALVAPAPADAELLANGKIAYAANCGISTMSANGALPFPVTFGAGSHCDREPAWSRDGSKIAFVRNGKIYWVWAYGGTPQLVTPDSIYQADNPAWSPDGTRIAFDAESADGTDIWVVGINGLGLANLTGNHAENRNEDPVWSPDGSRIAYHAWVPDGGGTASDIFVMKADGTAHRDVTPGLHGYDSEADWSPDGSRIAFQHVGDIWVMDANGANRGPVFTSNTIWERHPTWSSSGNKLAYEREGNEVHVVDANGTNDTVVTQNGREPNWSRKFEPGVVLPISNP